MTTNKVASNHFENLPHKGTVVSLLDRKSTVSRHAIVVSRVKRNGKLRLAFLGSNGKINYTVAVPNGSNWAADKTVRYRWAFSPLTFPKYPETAQTVTKARKVGDVHPASRSIAQA